MNSENNFLRQSELYASLFGSLTLETLATPFMEVGFEDAFTTSRLP